MSWHALGGFLFAVGVCVGTAWAAGDSRFAQTHSRSQYVHWIDLYDANNRQIDPADPKAPPYSPLRTCGRCHDYEAIAHGYHFNALQKAVDPGRRGEPWIWTDTRMGTQIPLSYRGWEGTYDPGSLGISPRDFVLQFGRHFPGGGPGEPEMAAGEEPAAQPPAGAAEGAESAEGESAEGEQDAGRAWTLSGELNVDCMICHSNTFSYSPEIGWDQIGYENFAWAPTAALGLGQIEGRVSSLPDDFDPATVEPDSRHQLPRVKYDLSKFNAEQKVFFDIARQPHNNACYYCHSTHLVGQSVAPDWTLDEDVHLRAGMSCTDCHRNGIDHHTVRGFEGEQHPTGQDVTTLSCRGCHLGSADAGGRLGAPRPLHKGLPPLHFEKMSCTSCHSGPRPSQQALQVQTAMAHRLGLPEHFTPEDPPGVVTPVFLQDEGVLYPHRMTWPAFWGKIKDDKIVPLNPEDAYDALRRTLRVKRGKTFTETMSVAELTDEDKVKLLSAERAKLPDAQWTDEEKSKLAELEKTKGIEAWREKLAESLEALQEIIVEEGAAPVFVAGGKAYRLNQDKAAEEFSHDAAKPYAWPLAHDVRPARWSSGITGCYECHADGAPFFEGQVTAVGPAPDEKPARHAMYELAGYDKSKLDAWNASFQGRTAFKWFGFAASGVVGLIVLSYLVAGINGLFAKVFRK